MTQKASQKAVKEAFTRARGDIKHISTELDVLKQALLQQNQALAALNKKISALLVEKTAKTAPFEERDGLGPIEPFFLVSTGNDEIGPKTPSEDLFELESAPETKQISTGHQAVKQVQKTEIKQAEPSKTDFKRYKRSLNISFKHLSKQELKAFLSIYQLEDDQIEATYSSIADKMELSEACIRGYVANLLKKGVPIVKSKINNKIAVFHIDREFKELNLKKKIIALFYQHDASQTQLFEEF